MRNLSLLLAGATLLSLGGCSSSPPERPVGSTSNPIVGGTVDTTHQAVMYLQYAPQGSNMGAACTGTLVAVQGSYGYLLTAAHCVLGEPGQPLNAKAADFTVVQGDDVATSQLGYQVVDFKADPLYSPSGQGITYDFAMVKFTGVGSKTPAPIPMLTAANDDLKAGSPVDIVGYGITSAGQQGNTKRRHVNNTLANIGFMQAVTQLTIAYEEGGGLGGACSGDSGGPVLYTVGGTQYVAGVTSYGDQNCSQYGVSGRVSAAVDQFINPYIQGGNGTQTCAQCQEASTSGSGACMSTVSACQNDAGCSALVQCFNNCAANDSACIQTCAQQNQAGVPLYNDIIQCACQTACATECASDPSCSGTKCGFAFNDATCGQCVDGACCSQEQACADDATCTSCVTASNPPASCSSNALVTAFEACASQNCNTQCGGGGGAGGAGGAGGTGGAGGAAGTGGSGGAAGSSGAGGGTGGTAGTGGVGGGAGAAGGSAGGSGSVTTDGGAAGAGGSGVNTGSPNGDATSDSSGSCSVGVPGSSAPSAPVALFAGLAALAVAGRRRRR